jgi:hypothetical protein
MIRLLGLLLVLTAAVPAAAAPLERFRDRLFVDAQVNGVAGKALLDSGAEMTILDDDFAARLGLVLTGTADAHGSGAATMTARFVEGVTLSGAGLDLPGRTVAVLDLDEVAGRLIGRRVDLLLGRDLFDAGRIAIDIAAGTVQAVSRTAAPEGVRLPLAAERGIETFPARVEGAEPIAAVFDLGNGSEVMIGRSYAERIGLAAPERLVGRGSGGGLGGEVQRDLVLLRELEIAGRTFRDVPAAIDDSPTASDLNIGTRLLAYFRITADFAERALWLAPHP